MENVINEQDMKIFNKSKIGNLFIYLSNRIDNLFLTKLLKLTYIIDELAVKETGAPVTWLNYKVWKNGPVPQKVYYNLRFENGQDFSDFIKVEIEPKTSGQKIVPVTSFDDSEFSDYEIELFDKVISQFGTLNSSQLIDYLHIENSLWHRIVVEKGLSSQFDAEFDPIYTSPYDISLKDAISDPFLVNMYDEMSHNIAFIQKLEA